MKNLNATFLLVALAAVPSLAQNCERFHNCSATPEIQPYVPGQIVRPANFGDQSQQRPVARRTDYLAAGYGHDHGFQFANYAGGPSAQGQLSTPTAPKLNDAAGCSGPNCIVDSSFVLKPLQVAYGGEGAGQYNRGPIAIWVTGSGSATENDRGSADSEALDQATNQVNAECVGEIDTVEKTSDSCVTFDGDSSTSYACSVTVKAKCVVRGR